ncbi:MAG: 4-hydroxybenzoate 3-monooxygenase [Polyangiaceae bacterium]|nr:4-hydroxybenzoate 3-monooxygenase [Polyangiaceae bacterium]
MRTQVGIVGAGPAGLMLGQLLHLRGIDSVIVEKRGRDYVIDRVRAGVLEPGTVDLLTASGVGDRLAVEGLRRGGVHFNFAGARHRIDLVALAGSPITIYGQNEVLKDLIDARIATDRPLVFEAEEVRIEDLESSTPKLRFQAQAGEPREIVCDFIAGCDGFHGVCRATIPPGAVTTHERVYPFSWLGILAEATPASEELIYAYHERGFALHNQRSPTLIRAHVQCPPDDDLSAWPDERVWSELRTRTATASGWRPNEGPILKKSLAAMRGFVTEPMRYRRLFLAGDSAHIFPPSGAKGLNMAIADAQVLADAIAEHYASASDGALDLYSDTCLRRVWNVQQFACWMTQMLHRFDPNDEFEHRTRLSELEHLMTCREASTSFARRYLGLSPISHDE